MAKARCRLEWEQTSSVMAIIANGLLRGKGKPAFTPNQFNPFAKENKKKQTPVDKAEASKEGWAILRAALKGNHKPETNG